MTLAEDAKCVECGRANGPSAARCLWCGVPIQHSEVAAAGFAATTVELDYLDGIKRFDQPVPVQLTISVAGIGMKEILPGTRTFFLAAGAILGAEFTDASVMMEQEAKRGLWGWLMLGSGSARPPKTVAEINHDYILTIGYRLGEEIKTAVFHREDSPGLSYVKNVAAIITALVNLTRNRGNVERI